MQTEPDAEDDSPPPADLGHAGAIIDKAIGYMIDHNVSPLAIASALLGGALGMLARTLPEEAILRILDNAMESVRAGELRSMTEEPDGEANSSS